MFILKDPELLILDEPTNGLDPVGMAEMRTLIRGLGDEGRAVLLSSHQLGEVEQICDRVGVLFHGRLVTEGTVQELRGAGRLVVRATPLAAAEACLVGLLGRPRVTVHQDELHLDAPPGDAPRLSRQLIGAGIDLHELRRDERSLEEAFLALSAVQEREEGADAA